MTTRSTPINTVEYYNERPERYARLVDPYDGAISQFSNEFNLIMGLVNLRLLWGRIDKSPPPPGRWEAVIDWNGAVPPAGNAPF